MVLVENRGLVFTVGGIPPNSPLTEKKFAYMRIVDGDDYHRLSAQRAGALEGRDIAGPQVDLPIRINSGLHQVRLATGVEYSAVRDTNVGQTLCPLFEKEHVLTVIEGEGLDQVRHVMHEKTTPSPVVSRIFSLGN